MDIEAIKYYTCEDDDDEAILLVDPETESIPETDDDGNLQYYCNSGHHTFSVYDDD
jgi:hypothetical protein